MTLYAASQIKLKVCLCPTTFYRPELVMAYTFVTPAICRGRKAISVFAYLTFGVCLITCARALNADLLGTGHLLVHQTASGKKSD